jgi:hypothetical protein
MENRAKKASDRGPERRDGARPNVIAYANPKIGYREGEIMRPLRILYFSFAVTASIANAAVVTVTSTGDTVAVDGFVTLREALTSTNANASVNADVVAVGAYGSDVINFNISGAGPHTIALGSALPAVTDQVTINGYSQPGSSANTLATGNDAVLNIILNGGTNAFHGFTLSAADSEVRGLVFNRFNIAVQINTNDTIVAGNFIGTDAAGLVADGNTRGIEINVGALSNNVIGGPAPADRNLISGNGVGITLNSSAQNPIQGNYIGTNRTGLASITNTFGGILIGTVGGVPIAGPAIGGDTGVGTPGTGPGNVISGNGQFGIRINSGTFTSSPGAIQGNIIGLNAAGTAALGNQFAGISLQDDSASSGGLPSMGLITIGGSASTRNVVSGNGGSGILAIAAQTMISSNFIGTDITGTAARPNSQHGLDLNGGGSFAGNNTVTGNTISGNSSNGIRVALTTASITGNRIGTAADGIAPLPNNGFGILVTNALALIGGDLAGQGNIIANNGNHGVQVEISGTFVPIRATSDARITGNSITQNGSALAPLVRMGINLNVPDLVTLNDAGDPDVGPNLLQNFPVLTSANVASGNVTVSGTLNSNASTTYRIEFFSNTACEANGFGQGKTFLGFTNVTTDISGNAAFGPLVFPVPPGESVITSTATNSAAGLTSEFSACFAATVPPGPTATINNVSANEGNAGTTPFTFTVTLSAPAAGGETVNYSTANGSAIAPGDYTAVPAGVVTFLAGATTADIIINVNGDGTVEPDENFTVTLTGGTGVSIGSPSQGTGTILNDDAAPLPTASINNVSNSEGDAGPTPFTFTVTLSAPASGTETVTYSTSDGSAVAPGDYTAVAGGVVTFAAGATTAQLTINVNGDTTVEPNETFTVTLTSGTGVTIGSPAAGTGNIINDDVTPGEDIPTTSQWMLLLIAASLATIGIAMNRRP